MSREIPLTKGFMALVDDEDFDWLNQFKWFSEKGYAGRSVINTYGKISIEYMHRVILGAKKGEHVDHINGIKADNRRSNLRICNHSQNQLNRGAKRTNRSGFKRVSCANREQKWMAFIKTDGGNLFLGSFTCPRLAAFFYNSAAIGFHGEFSRLNKLQLN